MSKGDTVWICGEYISGDKPHEIVWALEGIFSTEELATSACRTESHFIAPLDMDKACPSQEPLYFLDCRYPLMESKE